MKGSIDSLVQVMRVSNITAQVLDFWHTFLFLFNVLVKYLL